ncbi:MAG: DivIVA domain-containing protein [Oscillospiraceae bacterium]|nr:DivIVA domain-containing protein [Oscillospiraceae bacterium]MDD6085218.1 DivIVA domain-containing protein [Oscillospiraceae bacterium]MDY3258429.1 DivIVA domain-containing protein [Ruminococcus callidus]
MISSRDIRDKKFEKAAFGYKQEEIDEFLDLLEAEFVEIENERDDSNNKIQILADKVREYMRDEDALKDALLDAQKQGHKIISEANDRADEIIADAQKKADALMEEATTKHQELMEENRKEIEREKKNLLDARKEVADFKKKLFEMYKEHLEYIQRIPELDENFSSDKPKNKKPVKTEKKSDDKTVKNEKGSLAETYESRFKDSQQTEQK